MIYNEVATDKLNSLKRIGFEQIGDSYDEDVLLYTDGIKLLYKEDKIYQEDGKKLKDLLRVIKITDPLNIQYESTNILSPRVYAEKQIGIPQHISVQSLFFHRLSKENLEHLKNIILSTEYNKTVYDNMWIGYQRVIDSLKDNDLIYLMNRRVGGWDGSLERPVIELLCGGGHLPTIWDEETKLFKTLDPKELLIKEVSEELGISILPEKILELGGFHNEVSNELVILCALFVDYNELIDMINNSKGNTDENIDGIYMGIFDDVMKLYDLNPSFFAGGEKAKSSNFPSNPKLMKKIENILK